MRYIRFPYPQCLNLPPSKVVGILDVKSITRANCIRDIAIREKDIRICYIDDARGAEPYCQKWFNEQKDPKLCDKLKSLTFMKDHIQDFYERCISTNPGATENDCSKLTIGSEKSFCYRNLAIVRKDASLCFYVPHTASQTNDLVRCVKQVKDITGDISVCNILQTASGPTNVLQFVDRTGLVNNCRLK